jgi:hypothetical protein
MQNCLAGKLLTFVIAPTLCTAISGQVRTKTENKTAPTPWKTARVIEVKSVAGVNPNAPVDPEVLKGDPMALFPRRFYVVNDGEKTLSFLDVEGRDNQKQFQTPCLSIGETIQYRTHSETARVSVPSHPEWPGKTVTNTFVDLKHKKRGCLVLTLAIGG